MPDWWRQAGSRPSDIVSRGSAGVGGRARAGGSAGAGRGSAGAGLGARPFAGGTAGAGAREAWDWARFAQREAGGPVPSARPGYTPLYGGGRGLPVPERGGYAFERAYRPGYRDQQRAALGRAVGPAIDWFQQAAERVRGAGRGQYTPMRPIAAPAAPEVQRGLEALGVYRETGRPPQVITPATFGQAAGDIWRNLTQAPVIGSAAAALGEAATGVGGGLIQALGAPAVEAERAIGGTAAGLYAVGRGIQERRPLPELGYRFRTGYQLGREALGPIAYTLAGEQLGQAVRAIGGPESGTLRPMFVDPAQAGVERARQAMALREQGATPQQIAEQTGNPLYEAAGQILLDPLNFIGVGATARRQAGEASLTRRYFTAVDPRGYDEIGDALRAGANPRPAAGPIESIANVINPRTQAGRAEALIEDTSDVVSLITHQAQDPQQRVTLIQSMLDLADPNPTIAEAARNALADFGDIPTSQAGKQATVFLRRMATDEATGLVDPGVIGRIINAAETPEEAAEALIRRMENAAGEFYQVKRGATGGVVGQGFLDTNPVKKFQNSINGVLARYFHLGYSPSYAHRNLATNLLHSLADGNLPFASADNMGLWAQRFGFRGRGATRAAAGASGITTGAGQAVGAGRFRPTTMGEAYRVLGTKEAWKQGPGLALGQQFERWTAERVWYKATRTTWDRAWRYGQAIPANPVIDSLPGPLRNWLMGRVSGAMDARELRQIAAELRGRAAPQVWRAPDADVMAALREVNPDLADQVADAGRMAGDPDEFARRLDDILSQTDGHTAQTLADDAPMLTQADPAADDVTLIAQTEGSIAATETGRRIAAGRQQRDAARVMAWTRLEDVPANVRQAADQVGDWIGRNIVDTYRQADEATARWMRREIEFDAAEQIKSDLWRQFTAARDAQYQQAIAQLGDEARPALVLRQADDAVIAQAAQTKQRAASVWQRYRAGEMDYDGAKAAVEALWTNHNRYSVTKYDEAWRMLGGDPGRGPLARIGLEPIQRSPALLRRELAATALEAGIPGARINAAGDLVPHPRLLATVNKELRERGLPTVRRLSDMDAQQMEAAIDGLRRRIPRAVEEAAEEVIPHADPPERAIQEIVDSLDDVPPTRATVSAEANVRVEPLLQQIRDGIPGAAAADVGRLDPRTAQQVENWLTSLAPRLNETKLVASRVGTMERDFALLNYGDRRLSDQLLGYVMMYGYWPQHTAVNWARRIANNPALLNRYLRYKQAQQQMNKDLPEWWREQVSINLFGFQQYANLEQTLNPLYGMINDFQDRDRGGPGRPFGELMQQIGDIGAGSPWMPLQMVYALGLAQRGDSEGAQAWAGYMGTPTRTLRYATALAREMGVGGIPAGGLVLEPWLWQGGMFQGGDKWERRRIGKALYDLHREGTITYEQMVDAAYSQQGDIWNSGMQRAAVQRAPGQLAGFLLGQGFKTRYAYEIEIDRASDEWFNLMEQRNAGMDPEQYAAMRDDFLTRYPWMPAIWMSKKGDAERDTSMAWDALNRLPPGNERQRIIEAARLPQDLMDRFYADGGDMTAWTPQDRSRLMAGVLDIAATLQVPDAMTKREWQQVKALNQNIYREAERRWPGIDRTQDRYFEIAGTQGDQAADAYLSQHPELRDYWEFKTQRMTDDARLFAYYGEQRDLERRALNDLYAEAERRWPGAQQTQQEYFNLKDSGGDARAYLSQHPELREYWDYVRIGKAFIAQFPPPAPNGTQPSPARVRPDLLTPSITQQAIATGLQRGPTVPQVPTPPAVQPVIARGPGLPAPTTPAVPPVVPGAAPMTTTVLPQAPQQLEQWRGLIETNAEATGLDPRILATVMYIESRGRPGAVSSEGAIGLMQVMPQGSRPVFADRPTVEQLQDPAFNVEYGSGILKSYIDYFQGDARKGIAAYYMGRSAVETKGLESDDAQVYLGAFDKAWRELWGNEPLSPQAPAGVPLPGQPAPTTMGAYTQQMQAATGDPLAWTFQHGTAEELQEALTSRMYDEAEQRFPGMREASAEYGRLKDAGASKAELKAYRESQPGITDYWDFTKAGREYLDKNTLEPGGTQAQLDRYLAEMIGGPGAAGGRGLAAPIPLDKARSKEDFHLGPRSQQYKYRMTNEAWNQLPEWARAAFGSKPYATPLYGPKSGGGGGGGGWGGRRTRRVSPYVMRKMSAPLLAQLQAFFAGGPALEEGALRELMALGIGDVESLRNLFVGQLPTPLPGRQSYQKKGAWRSW